MSDATARVLLYSDDRTVRQQVRLALGSRVSADTDELEVFDVATEPGVFAAVRNGGIDLIILDAEATPAGGMGVCRGLKDEIADCPPIVLLVARVADAWLASWCRAEAVCAYPVDPERLPAAVADLLRAKVAGAAS